MINQHKYKVGDLVNVQNTNREILEQIRYEKDKGKAKGYIYRCLKCNYIGKIREYDIARGIGCPSCAGQVPLTTDDVKDRIVKQLGENFELVGDFKNSITDIEIRHTICDNLFKTKLHNLLRLKTCPICSRNRRYSYLHIVLMQFLEYTYSTVCSEYDIGFKGMRGGVSKYDIYVKDLNLLIECQSQYHKNNLHFDMKKREFAIQNGYKFLSFDCEYQTPLEAIQYFDKTIVSVPNYIDYYKYGKINLDTIQNYLDQGKTHSFIAQKMNISKRTINTYRNQGKLTHDNRKKVVQVDKFGNLIKEYVSLSEASRMVNMPVSQISNCVLKKHKTGRGFIWLYKDDYDKNGVDLLFHNSIERPNSKKVRQYDKNDNYLNSFNSINEASRHTGVYNANIRNCCNNERKYAGGFIWRYDDGYEAMHIDRERIAI